MIYFKQFKVEKLRQKVIMYLLKSSDMFKLKYDFTALMGSETTNTYEMKRITVFIMFYLYVHKKKVTKLKLHPFMYIEEECKIYICVCMFSCTYVYMHVCI